MKITGQEPPLALLGRAAELAALTVTLGGAAAGSGSAILLRGEAGIGKTTLLAAAKQLAAGRGMRLLACCRCRSPR